MTHNKLLEQLFLFTYFALLVEMLIKHLFAMPVGKKTSVQCKFVSKANEDNMTKYAMHVIK